jgi:hypothetical protein
MLVSPLLIGSVLKNACKLRSLKSCCKQIRFRGSSPVSILHQKYEWLSHQHRGFCDASEVESSSNSVLSSAVNTSLLSSQFKKPRTQHAAPARDTASGIASMDTEQPTQNASGGSASQHSRKRKNNNKLSAHSGATESAAFPTTTRHANTPDAPGVTAAVDGGSKLADGGNQRPPGGHRQIPRAPSGAHHEGRHQQRPPHPPREMFKVPSPFSPSPALEADEEEAVHTKASVLHEGHITQSLFESLPVHPLTKKGIAESLNYRLYTSRFKKPDDVMLRS